MFLAARASSTPALTPLSSRSGSATTRSPRLNIYLHADMTINENAIAKIAPQDAAAGR